MCRIEKIKEIKENLKDLFYQKVFKELSSKNEGNNQWNSLPENMFSINLELDALKHQIFLLQSRLLSLQVHYQVTYKVKQYDNTADGFYREAITEHFHFTTDCNVDTFALGFPSGDSSFQVLFKEITDYLDLYRYSDFEILEIKKIQ